MDFGIIHELNKEDFYNFGGLYLYKTIKDSNSRKEQKKIDDLNASDNLNSTNISRTKIDYKLFTNERDLSSSKKKAMFDKKLHAMYNDILVKGSEDYDIENVNFQMKELKKNSVTGDQLILIPRTGLVGNEMVNIKMSSLIVIKLNSSLSLGFIVDKQAIQMITDMESVVDDE